MSTAFSKTQTLPASRNFVTGRCIVVLFGTSLCTFLNASRTATNDFDAKECSRMNTRSVRECNILALAQLFHNWREQRPSNKSDLELSVAGLAARVYYTGVYLLLI
jgi:hypothetical protein